MRIGIGINIQGGGLVAGVPPPCPDTLFSHTGRTARLALSTHLLRAAYAGPCIRLRRDSDNAEQDIGFDDGRLDISAAAAFLGGANGFVVTWYDQSGQGDDMNQPLAARQPMYSPCQINFNSALVFDANPWLERAGATWIDETVEITGVMQMIAVAGSTSIISVSEAGQDREYWQAGTNGGNFVAAKRNGGPERRSQAAGLTTDPSTFSARFTADNARQARLNGVDASVNTQNVGDPAVDITYVGRKTDVAFDLANAYIGEVIVWLGELSTGDRNAIEAHNNQCWGIT